MKNKKVIFLSLLALLSVIGILLVVITIPFEMSAGELLRPLSKLVTETSTQVAKVSACGNGVCEVGETVDNCIVDCFVKPKVKLERVVLGDYDHELRGTNGRVNISLMVDRLLNASINTYAFLLWWHPTSDWEDFLLFVDAANRSNIDTFAYLVPPLENCENVLPYRCDFNAWGTAIANLSLKYHNLKGWVIDDFFDLADETERIANVPIFPALAASAILTLLVALKSSISKVSMEELIVASVAFTTVITPSSACF